MTKIATKRHGDVIFILVNGERFRLTIAQAESLVALLEQDIQDYEITETAS